MKLASFFFVALFASAPFAAAAPDLAALQHDFNAPPSDTRPTVRWWWFGPAVVKPQLAREMTFMKSGGFGGFEVQPTYPLALDGEYPGLKNLRFLSPEFFDMLRFTGAEAKKLGLRMDLTLGSGWPYGGSMFTREEAAQSIREGGTVAVTPGQTTAVLPPPTDDTPRTASAEPLIAALLGPVKDAAPGASPYLVLPIENGIAQLPADLRGATKVTFFVGAPADLMRVKRPAYGAEGFIIDHYSPAAVAKFIDQIARPELAALAANPPYSVFCDSLEIAGEGWTPDFPAEFRRRRGYDIMPLLPALFDANFPRAAEIRADYGRTLAEIFNAVFVDAFRQLAHEHDSRFRIQAYGTPPTTLSTYAHADLTEGENYGLKVFSGTRWASSASHLLGRAVTSSEAFTWLHSPSFMAAPLDIKAEANLQFLNGINQLVFHGWPYTAPGVEYPGWRFYAAGVFNQNNPWWLVMPDVTTYLARIGYLLRQGQPANDVALYLPEEDALTQFTPSSLEMAGAGDRRGHLNRLVSPFIPSILATGHNFDFIDDGLLASRGRAEKDTLAFGDSHYRLVILPNVTRIPLAALQKLAAFAEGGGLLVAVGHIPSLAPGYLATAADHAAIRALAAQLFTGPGAKGLLVPEEAQLRSVLQNKLQPDVMTSGEPDALGFVHRHTAAGEIYFLTNPSDQPLRTTPLFRVQGLQPEWWNPVTGEVTAARVARRSDQGTSVAVELPPFGAQFLVFTPRHLPAAAALSRTALPPLEWSRAWDVSFKNSSDEPDPAPQHFSSLESWTDKAATRYFSGVATYEKQVEVPAARLQPGARHYLDFGTGHPAKVAGGRQGFRANFQPPIGDAAVVYLNGRRVGSVWCPPYRLEVTGFLQPGTNHLQIEVANRAINFMADREHHPLPDYTALNADPRLGGNRFQPQDMQHITTTPSGLLEQVVLVSEVPATTE